MLQNTFETATSSSNLTGNYEDFLYSEEILKENKMLLSLQTSVLLFFKAS